MVERYKAEIGHAIARRRLALGLTQHQLAEAAHYKPQTVSRWERGLNLPSNMDPIVAALQTTLEDLVAGVEIPARAARGLGLCVPTEPTAATPDLFATLPPSVEVRLAEMQDQIGAIFELVTSLVAGDDEGDARGRETGR